MIEGTLPFTNADRKSDIRPKIKKAKSPKGQKMKLNAAGHDPRISSGCVLEQHLEPHLSSAVSFGPDHERLDFTCGLCPQRRLHELYR